MKTIFSVLALSFFWISAAVHAHEIDIEKLKQELKAEILAEIKAEQQKAAKPAAKPTSIIPTPAKQAKAEIPEEKKTSIEMTDKGLAIGDMIRFTGQVRVRPELKNNMTLAPQPVPADTEPEFSTLLRTRFGLEFLPDPHVSFFIQGQDARDFGEEVPSAPTIAGDDEGLDLHQGYIDLKNIGNRPFFIRVGRQEINLGDQRLVGAVNWSNFGRALDGILLSYEPEEWGLKAIGAVVDRTGVTNLGDGQYFAGLYGTWKKFPNGVLDGYYLMLHDADAAVGAAAGTGDTQSVHTVGFRIKAVLEGGFDYGVESAVQFGKFGSNSILAFAAHGHGGYTWKDASWKPRVGLEYNYATGDDPASGRYTKFNNLIPTNHDKYGLIDFAQWTNIHDAAVLFSVKPHEKWNLGAEYHLQFVDQNESIGDTFAGVAGAPGVGKIAGHEIDLTAKYTLNRYFDALAGYSHFIPGSFLKDQGRDRQAEFFYLQLAAQF